MALYQGVKQINQEEYVIIQPSLMLLDYKILFKINFLKMTTFKGLINYLKKKKYNFSQIHLFKKTFNIATVNVKNEYRGRLEEITKQINNLLNNIASGIAVEETNNKINELEKEKETIEEKLIESEQKEKDNKVSLNMIKNLKATWFDMDFDEQRRIIEHLIDKVIVNDNEINIYYNIY